MKRIVENAPDVAKSFFNLTDVITDYGHCVDKKTKELILVGMFTASDGYRGAVTHAQRALEAGATKREIVTTILLAIPVVGISKVNLSLEEIFRSLEMETNYEDD